MFTTSTDQQDVAKKDENIDMTAPSGGISKEDLDAAYRDWCKDTGRNGGVLIGKSIRELFEYLSTLSNGIENIRQIHELDLHLVDEHGMDPNAPMLGDDFFPTLAR